MRIIGNDPKTPRQTQVVASGTLSTGDAVVVNADGTVSGVSGSTANTGSRGTFTTDIPAKTDCVYDVGNDKVIILKGGGDASAYVGTVSGSSLSFGTAQIFRSIYNVDHLVAKYDPDSGNIVIAYRDYTGYGTAIVGSVSGSTMSFGTAVVFNSGSTQGIDMCYDTSNNKIIITYKNDNNSDRGTAIIGTVSGTSISFGTAVTFTAGYLSSGLNNRATSCAYDSANNKVFVSYLNGTDSYAYGIVGTVSGTSISFGTASAMNSTASAYLQAEYDENSGKVVLAYTASSETPRSTYTLAATISGTSVSAGTPSVMNNTMNSYWTRGVYDSSAKKVCFASAYYDGVLAGSAIYSVTVSGTSVSNTKETGTIDSESHFGLAFESSTNYLIHTFEDNNDGFYIMHRNASTNITANNFIGTAQTGASDGNRVVVNIKGAIDENQSGLTAGQSYYVQNDGSLGTTAADPSVFAGTAVSATKLIVKG